MFPFEIVDLNEADDKDVREYFKGQMDGCVLTGPEKYCFPKLYEEHAENYYNLEIRDDDVWIVTFPRSGTTWTQELMWLLLNNLDFEKAKTMKGFDKVPFYDMPLIPCKSFVQKVKELNENHEDIKWMLEMTQGYESVKNIKSPRFIKTHLPLSLLPPNLLDKAKVVYVARNPKDVAVSYYHHNKGIGPFAFQGDFQKYWEFFEKGLVVSGPQVPHVQEAWAKKDHPNLLFLFYEDSCRDFTGTIKKVASFLNKSLTEEDIAKLNEALKFDRMKNSGSMKPPKTINEPFPVQKFDFFRRGKVGGNEEFSEELEKRADKWVAEQEAKYGIKFLRA